MQIPKPKLMLNIGGETSHSKWQKPNSNWFKFRTQKNYLKFGDTISVPTGPSCSNEAVGSLSCIFRLCIGLCSWLYSKELVFTGGKVATNHLWWTPQQTKTALEKESPSFPNISKGAPELGSLSCLGHMPNAEPISGKWNMPIGWFWVTCPF